MSGRWIRLIVALALLVGGLVYVFRSSVDVTRATLIVTAVICVVTAIYALLTFEILLQNQEMARAAAESTNVMERSLRFSYAPNLLFRTINVKDPKMEDRKDVVPVDNEDYQTALREFAGGGQAKEFVFAIVQNVGRGAATSLEIDVQYDISDTSSPNRHYTVTKREKIQILRPDTSLALCIWVSKVPTSDDRVDIRSATLRASDFYRDALGETPHRIDIDRNHHQTESEAGCVVSLT
jgi:hypothetical protein